MTMASEITTLTFTPDNSSNTIITSLSGEILYRVITAHSNRTITYVRDAQDELVATLEWHETSSDKVSIRGGEAISFSEWVKKSYIPFKE